MRRIFFILFVVMFVFVSPCHAGNELKFHETGQDSYIAELNMSEEASEQDALAIIAYAAAKICGDKKPRLGQYRFKGEEELIKENGSKSNASFQMVQQLRCGDMPAASTTAVEPPSAAEKKQLEQRARQATKTYLGYLAQRDFEKAYSLFSVDLSTSVGFESWVQTKEQPAIAAGELLRGDVYKISTYVNPPSSPKSGIYIATDFDFEYENFPVFCGYLVWQVEGEQLRVIREDIGKLTAEQFEAMGAQKVKAAKSALRCMP